MCRHANRTASVAANSCGAQARCDGRSLTPARPSGRTLWIPCAIGASVQWIFCVIRHEHLGNIGIAENNSSGVLEALDENSILIGNQAGASATATLEL